MYCVEINRQRSDGWGREWHLVGQYATRIEADRIAADYRSRGETARVTHDE